jgi:hypothetical protein
MPSELPGRYLAEAPPDNRKYQGWQLHSHMFDAGVP